MYTLTLTLRERKAIDWVGHRNWNGTSLYRNLWVCSDASPIDADWDSDCDITFSIPESAAWDIKECWKFEGREIPHFDDELKGKILTLINSII